MMVYMNQYEGRKQILTLTKKQEEGLKIAVERYKTNEPWTCIAGYAGTGKSTLIKFIISALNLEPSKDVAYVAFTGKAASVLRNKGCPNASTAHKLLYYSKKLPSGKFIFTPKHHLENDYKLIVVDEISMLPLELWLLLLSHGIHILACGDPFQLPPVNKDADNHVLDTPHIFLDEIMRQEEESEIIRLTMDIRNFKPINYFKGNEIQIISPEEVVDGMYTWADQIITATNRKRMEINNYMRAAAGRGAAPEIGDKIIACRNCWDITDIMGNNALVNGTIGYISNFEEEDKKFPIFQFPQVKLLRSTILSIDDDIFDDVMIDYQALVEGKKSLTPQQEYILSKRPSLKESMPIEFNYGYAITCHRAQGSEWDKVLVFEENFPFDKEEHARWLYTACTRPSQKLVLVR